MKLNISQVSYPNNLLYSLTKNTSLILPKTLFKSTLAGISYALSTLEEKEQQVLSLRYKEDLSAEETAAVLHLSGEEVQALEAEGLRKLRMPGRWNYIRHGVHGYLRLRMQEEHRKAYQQGYYDGYQKGLTAKEKDPIPNDFLDLPIETLGLSVRTRNCLARAQITTVREAVEYNEKKLLCIRNLGHKTGREIARVLRSHGITGTAWDEFLIYEDG